MTDETGMAEVLVVVKSTTEIDSFIHNLAIIIEKLPFMMTAREYGISNRQSLEDQGVEIISEKTAIINNIVMYELVYILENNFISLKYRNLCFVKDKVAFVITVSATSDSFDRFEQDFKAIIDTFTFI